MGEKFISIQLTLCQNNAPVSDSKNIKGLWLKHIGLKYYVVQEGIKDGYVVIEYTDTDDMITDPLNQALSTKAFNNYYY